MLPRYLNSFTCLNWVPVDADGKDAWCSDHLHCFRLTKADFLVVCFNAAFSLLVCSCLDGLFIQFIYKTLIVSKQQFIQGLWVWVCLFFDLVHVNNEKQGRQYTALPDSGCHLEPVSEASCRSNTAFRFNTYRSIYEWSYVRQLCGSNVLLTFLSNR